MYQVEIGEFIDQIIVKKIGAGILPLFKISVIIVIRNPFLNADLGSQIPSHLE